MSKTGIDSRGTARVRPASSTKVEDLEKKLFSKLDSYEGPSKKSALKRGVKSIKQIDNDSSTGTESTPEGYEKMQKRIPPSTQSCRDSIKSSTKPGENPYLFKVVFPVSKR